MADAARDIESGRVRFERGPYWVERVLGRGRMGVVHMVRRGCGHDTGERFAMKRLLPELGHSPDVARIFAHEARIGRRVDHPNVVPVVDVGENEGTLSIVMPHVDGTSLSRLFAVAAKRGKAFPMDVGMFVARETLRGLGHLHELRDSDGSPMEVVHGDISPGNVLLGAMGEVMLTDFGAARSASGRHLAGGVDGKLGYMPPEQLAGHSIDRRADLFSVGILLFEMLTGTQFFQGVDDLDLVTKMREVSLEPLSSPIGRRLPLDLRLLLATALSRDPDDRFTDAGEFAWALELCALHSGIRLSRTGLIQWLRENDVWPLRSGFHAAVVPSENGDGTVKAGGGRRS